jgi:HK97 family phage major capsid protein
MEQNIMELAEIKDSLDQRDAAILEQIEKKTAALARVESENIALTDRLRELEQILADSKGSHMFRSAPPTIGQMVADSPQFKALMDGQGDKARIQLKTAIVNATGQNQPLVPADRLSGIVHGATRTFHMRDLLTVGRTTSNLIEFAKENTYTNSAGPQVGNSPEEFENVTKPESAITFTLQSQAVTTLAHWIPISKQVLSDSPMLQSYINSRLLYGLKLKEDTQILLGTGANGELPGLYTNRTAYAVTSPLSYTTRLDILRDALAQVEQSDYEPNGIVLNSADWKAIQLAKVSATDDRYVIGDPQNSNGPRLWGLPVVKTNSIASGTFLVGAFDMAAQLWDREDASVEVGLNGNDFVKNMVTLLCEERIGLTIYRSDAIVGGSFAVS